MEEAEQCGDQRKKLARNNVSEIPVAALDSHLLGYRQLFAPGNMGRL